MENNIVFYMEKNIDKSVVDLTNDALLQIQLYYLTKENENEKLSYDENKEIELMKLLISSSVLWIGKIIQDFDDLKNGKVQKMIIDEKDFNVLKYLVDFYWNNMPIVKEQYSQSVYAYFVEKENKCNNIHLMSNLRIV